MPKVESESGHYGHPWWVQTSLDWISLDKSGHPERCCDLAQQVPKLDISEKSLTYDFNTGFILNSEPLYLMRYWGGHTPPIIAILTGLLQKYLVSLSW